MSAEETTPAIERAGEAIFGHDDSGESSLEDVRRGLAAALDVEEIAKVLYDHSDGSARLPHTEDTVWKCIECGVALPNPLDDSLPAHQADMIRAAILGGTS